MYIAGVALLAAVLLGYALARYGLDLGVELGVLVALALAFAALGEVEVEGRNRLSLWSILVLAAQPIVGPAGAGLLGALAVGLQSRSQPSRIRLFNTSLACVLGVVGGLAFYATGGALAPESLRSTADVATGLGLPLLVANVAQLVGNILLLAGVVGVSTGGRAGTIIVPLLRGTGLANLGFGVIAFLMVVLWKPADVGPAAVLLVLAPLLGAQWAYRQHAEELEGQNRAIEVLVAAVEAKAPHLVGHSARVAELSALIAEELGMGPQAVADARMAGMLHDVGQTSLPTALVRAGSQGRHTGPFADYPVRGADLLRPLTFLAGSLTAIETHRSAITDTADGEPSRSALIVGTADEYDLLTEVGTPDGVVLGQDEAMTLLAPPLDAELVRALPRALLRRAAR